MKRTVKKNIFGFLFCGLIALCTYSYNSQYYEKAYDISATTFKGEQQFSNYQASTYANKELAYLSDIPYIKEQSGVGLGEITLDANLDSNYNNGLISLLVNGKQKLFLKGISAHATSTLVYDISELNYDYFKTYYGVDSSSGNKGNGVKFSIYTSVDGKTWNLETSSSKVQKGNMDAEQVTISIKDKKYIKLYCNSNGNKDSDYCAYGDAKLYKEGYQEKEEQPYSFIKTLEEYDTILKNSSYDEVLTTKENLLLQRKFVSNFGYDLLQSYAHLDDERKATLEWIMTDTDALRYYVTGGSPVGSYIQSLNVLNDLYSNHKKDLKNTTRTQYTELGDLYKRMMITLSLTHSSDVCLWIDGSQCSDAITRYEIYKSMQSRNLLKNEVFETLTIEEMRWVMNNNIDDEEIEWLNHHIRRNNLNIDPYRYITYGSGYNYNLAQYYNVDNYDMWNEKYHLADYNITYQVGKPKLWIVFEQGAVCGGISKTGSNINGSLGNPSAVISQPGNAAYLEYMQTSDGKGWWRIKNDVGGWTVAEKSERLLADWGSNKEDSFTSSYNAIYVVYAQEALNNIEAYNKALEVMALADIYENDPVKLEEIYRKALSYQSIHFDAWLGLIRSYEKNNNKTALDYMNLAKELADSMYEFPLPMTDLLKLIEPHVKGSIYAATFTNYVKASLEKGTVVGISIPTKVLKPDLTRLMANHLLVKNDYSIANFSFDGKYAKQIRLGSKYSGNNAWEYSLDSGKTWITVNKNFVTLTEEEIESITTESHILIHILGVNYDSENIYMIPITKGTISNELYGNDLENRVLGVNSTYEWRFSGDTKWNSYAISSPDLTGDKTVEVRVGATKTYLPSESKEFTFTTDFTQDLTRKYVPVSRLSIASVSSEATALNQKGSAIYAIDGNPNTRWHSVWNGSDNEKYIIIKFDKPIYLSAIEYVPASGGNGKIQTASFEGSLDGKNFNIPLGKTSLWGDDILWGGEKGTRKWNWPESYRDQPIQYLKITGIKTSTVSGGSFIAASMFTIYEDSTKIVEPTAGISYSIMTPTNSEVVAKLVNFNNPDIVVDGPDSYTFTENGTYTFKFHDSKTGAKGTATANVDWIDKEAPTAMIEYSTTKLTNGDVIATLKPNEEITVLNNGSYEELEAGEKAQNPNANPLTYTFMENGEFTFRFKDKAGNIGTATAKVTWIDKENIISELTYDRQELTNKDVTVTIQFEKENIKIINNYGKNTYTFTDNGEFTFYFMDEAGNIGTKSAYVNWIDKIAPNVKITYTTKDPTKDPVTAVISSDEVIAVVNNGGDVTYTFTENGTFDFIYEDALGNTGKATASVNWILDENGELPNNNQNIIYKDFSLVDVKVSVPSDKMEEEGILKKGNFMLPNSLKQKFHEESELFELYIENSAKQKVSFPSTKLKITFALNPSKKFLGIYELQDDETLKALEYKVVGGNKIEVEVEDLGKYIVSYENKKVEKESIQPMVTTDLKVYKGLAWKVVLGISILSFGIFGIVIMKHKKKQN